MDNYGYSFKKMFSAKSENIFLTYFSVNSFSVLTMAGEE